MKITFLGAAGTVTGSSYILTSGSGQSIVIDLGMFQGLPEIDELNYKPYRYDASKLSGGLLTHAHLDHCGRLPILLQGGFNAPIWMTAPTRDLAELSLLDTARIATQDRKPILFDKTQAQKMVGYFKTTSYRQPFTMGDFRVTLRDAGHLMGAASLEIEDLASNTQTRKIIFSGDLGNSPEELLHNLEYLESADVVVMESTYGDRLHPQEDPVAILQKEINTIEQTNATLLIPSFALERTQELLHMIMHMKRDGRIAAATPIYLDSPMADHATHIYTQHINMFNPHVAQEVSNGSAFQFEGLDVLKKRDESHAVQQRAGEAKVILAGSGMMVGGRIVGHAAHYLPMSTTRLLIVGYQGEGTLGRKLLEGEKEVEIDGQTVTVNATVSSTQALSSHADQVQLMDWLSHIKGVQKVILTHGEDGPRTALSSRIQQELGIQDVLMPHLHEELEV